MACSPASSSLSARFPWCSSCACRTRHASKPPNPYTPNPERLQALGQRTGHETGAFRVVSQRSTPIPTEPIPETRTLNPSRVLIGRILGRWRFGAPILCWCGCTYHSARAAGHKPAQTQTDTSQHGLDQHGLSSSLSTPPCTREAGAECWDTQSLNASPTHHRGKPTKMLRWHAEVARRRQAHPAPQRHRFTHLLPGWHELCCHTCCLAGQSSAGSPAAGLS